ncbi:hypothetical protein MLD38_012137 [Melastoma candidum]|uniref:Uncharacterized protein n=1 Tax=Melastoma candidum TaxID=119954 RepID=A0ACB9R4T0_9MYRT|nr:hypothetical protein MLD38_012137 [Melastoma candidum]
MSPEDPNPPSSPALAPFPSSPPTIPDALLQRLECQSPVPLSQSLNRQFPHPPSWSLDCHSPSLSSWCPAVHPPGHLAQGPNLHPGGDSPPLVSRSRPSGFLQQQMPDLGPAPLDTHSPFGFLQQQMPDLGPAPLDTHSSFPLALDDTNPMACPSSTSLNPDSLLMNPLWPMPSHPSPLMPTRAAHYVASIPPTYALSPAVNSRSSRQFLPWLQPSPSPSLINAQVWNFNTQWNKPIDTTAGYRYIMSNMPRVDPPCTCMPSSSHLLRMPSHAGNEALLRNKPSTRLRTLSQSHVPSQTSQPADSSTVQRRQRIPTTDSSTVQKRQRISTISETSNRGNGDVDTAPASHPGIQVRNPSPPIAQPIPNSDGNDAGNVAVPSPHTIQGSPISNPTVGGFCSVLFCFAS